MKSCGQSLSVSMTSQTFRSRWFILTSSQLMLLNYWTASWF